MSEENKKTTDDGQPTTDPSGPDKQQANNEASSENVSSPGPAVETEQTSYITDHTSYIKKDMEVHHHAHASHGKKKWNEYFWEFLMLFLAVFCGFLAEYQLEHKIEKDRELEFIKSLTIDLEDDAKNLDAIIGLEHSQMNKLDTLVNMLNDPIVAKQQGDQLYYVARLGPRSYPFANNSRTFDQLRYSGGFRLIRNADASNKIMGYYEQFSTIRLLEDNYNHEFDNYKRVGAKILDPAVLRKQEAENGEIIRGNGNPILMTYNPALLKELGFHALQMNGSRRSKVSMLENLKKTASALMTFLRDKYHLE